MAKRDHKKATTRRPKLSPASDGWQTIFDSLTDIIIVLNPEHQILRANKAAADFLKLSPAEITGKYCFDLIHGAGKPITECPVERMLKSGKPEETDLYLAEIGIWVQVMAQPIVNKKGALVAILHVVRDITGRKLTEKTLEQLKHQNELILNSAGEGIFGLDIQGNHTFVNPSAAKMLGYKVEELISKHSHSTWHYKKADGSPYPVEECPIYAALKDGEIRRVDIEVFWKKDGTSFPVEYVSTPIKEDGKITGSVVTFNDITRRKQSEEESQSILATAMSGFLTTDKQGKFLNVNESFCRISGYSREELLKMSIRDLEALETATETTEHIKRIMKEGQGRFETRHRRKDGKIIDVEVSMTYRNIRGGRFFIFFRDVTDRKQAEDALRKSEERFRLFSETSIDYIFQADKNGKLIYCSPAVERILGYTPEERLGTSFVDVTRNVSPSKIAELQEIAGNLMRGKIINKLETELLHKSGRPVPVEISAVPIFQDGELAYIFGIARDITERKQREAEMRNASVEIEDLYNKAPCGYHSLDKDGTYVRINDTELAWLGYSREEIIGKKRLTDILTPQSREEHRKLFPFFKGQGWIRDVELDVVRKDGTTLPVLLNATAVKDADGNFLMSRATLFDMTKMKQISAEKEQAHQELVLLVNQLETRTRQNTILGEMRELLQSCSSMTEVAPIIRSSMEQLFPLAEGALFLMSASRSDLESAARWGDFSEDTDDNVFAPDACWGLRRGRAHLVENLILGPICPHLKRQITTAYTCLPLVAKGDVLGLLHLRSRKSATPPEQQKTMLDIKELAASISEYLSLSIANIKLGETLSRQSVRDPLTGLFNRRYLEESLHREILRAERKQAQIGIIMADIDHFKQFNDVYGHGAGDELLTRIGEFFLGKIRGADVACRYGGEEFLIFLTEASAETTLKRADQIREQIKNLKIIYQGEPLGSVSLSLGIAIYPDHGTNAADLLRKADTALYKAKQEGRDRIVMAQSGE